MVIPCTIFGKSPCDGIGGAVKPAIYCKVKSLTAFR